MIYRINSPHVVAETLDGEATIVDLEKGTYHALNKSGSLIWDQLTAGADPGMAAEGFAAAYDLEPAEASRVVGHLIDRLIDAELIVPAGEGETAAAAASTNGAGGNGTRGAYVPPELSTYTDMQELLLLDPIHEVDESGWPNRA